MHSPQPGAGQGSRKRPVKENEASPEASAGTEPHTSAGGGAGTGAAPALPSDQAEQARKALKRPWEP